MVAGSVSAAEGVPAPGPVPRAAVRIAPRAGRSRASGAGPAKRVKHCQQYSAVTAFWAPQLGQARSSTFAPSSGIEANRGLLERLRGVPSGHMAPVDLRSDTVTRPSPAMRKAMAEAEVGDDVFGDDPTVNRLQERAAGVTDKEAALYTVTGTMANQTALRTFVRHGHEVVAEATAHVITVEKNSAASLSGITYRPVPGERGVMEPGQIAEALRPDPLDVRVVDLVALEEGPKRLHEDHHNARRLAEGVAEVVPGGLKPEDVETNIVFVDPTPLGMTAAEAADRLRGEGVLVTIVAGKVRMLTHVDVSTSDVETAIEAWRRIASEA